MKHFSYAVNDLNALQRIQESTEITWNTKTSQAILVQKILILSTNSYKKGWSASIRAGTTFCPYIDIEVN